MVYNKEEVMEGQNILYGSIEDLKNVRGMIDARGKVRNEITSLTTQKTNLEKDLKAEEKQMADNIDTTVKKRRDQVVVNFDKEINNSQDKLKKVRAQRGKEKDKKVAARIKDETSDLVVENKNVHEEIRTFFKQKGMPTLCDSELFYTLYFPSSPKQFGILALAMLLGFIGMPWLVTTLVKGHWFVEILLTIVLIVLVGALYLLGYNYTHVRHKDAFIEMKPKRGIIRKNLAKIRRTKKSIKKDKDEEQYGLHEYDDDIQELEQLISDVVSKKNDALTEFEKTIKPDIVEEITSRDMPKIEKIKKNIAEVSLKLKELEQKQKDMSINLSTSYGTYLGEENMTTERIDMLISLIDRGEADNIGSAVNILKNASKK